MRYYCARCGWDTGQFTTYIPYVDIRWMANGFGTVWHKLWSDKQPSWIAKVGYFVFVLLLAPVMLVGLPFLWLSRHKKRMAMRASKPRV